MSHKIENYKKGKLINLSILTLEEDLPNETKKEIKTSKKEIRWIDDCREHFGVEIKTKQKIVTPENKRYYPDGYTPHPKMIIWEYMGCHWHQHSCIKKNRDIKIYDKTIERLNDLKRLGYNCFITWECENKLFTLGKSESLGYYY